MPDLAEDTTQATVYPPKDLYATWREHAEELDMSLSKFTISMVEAGRKQFSVDSEADESIRRLRQESADLQREVERKRDRIAELERQLGQTIQRDIVEYVAENPGVTAPQIIQRMVETMPARVSNQIDLLLGEELSYTDDGFYVPDQSGEATSPEDEGTQ